MLYLNLHTHRFTNNPEILEIVNQYPREFDASVAYYSIGIHPWHIAESEVESDLQIIESKLQQNSCLAVGECGLDKRIETDFNLQMKVFEAQLDLAQKHNKPVIIHCVAAFQEVIEIRNRLKISVPMVIHGFSKNVQVARQMADNGFYLSFGKYLLRNPELETVFQSVPDGRFFLETDTVEESIAEVYQRAAKYKKMELPELKARIGKNFESVFSIEF